MDDRSKQWRTHDSSIVKCIRCDRLVNWREEVAQTRRRAYRDWIYWGKPVPGFGDHEARVLIVGLAPGAHGANRTGRMFTGDGSGEFLFRALFRAEFANQPDAAHRDDGLVLSDVFITAVCRCVPPANKPTKEEIVNCLPYLNAEIELLVNLQVIVALGHIAFDNTLRLFRQKGGDIPRLVFSHGGIYQLDEDLPWLVASYHPSRQNTQTGRLTEEMFAEIWEKVKLIIQ